MKLKKITLNNIRSYKQQSIEFPEGSILLAGDIGSGKTSILLGIEFALFGLQPGQRGSSLLRNGEEKGGVRIEFEIDNKNIIVERNLKRGKSISQDYCSIEINGIKEEISVVELKSKVLELLNYPKEFSKKQNLLYKFTVYTPQEEMKQIILQDSLTRINTLRHVFGIDKYKRIMENTLLLTLKLREEKRRKEGMTINLEQDKINVVTKENELSSKHNNLSLIEKELILKIEDRKKVEEEKIEVSKKIEEKNKLSQEIEKTKIMISNKKETIFNNAKTIEQVRIQIKELEDLKFEESNISKTEQEIISFKKERIKLNEKHLEINSQITSLNNKNDDLNLLEQKFSNLESCPTCLQEVDAIYRANILNKSHNDKADNNRKIKLLQEEKLIISDKLGKIEYEINSKEKELTDLRILKIKFQDINERKTQLEQLEKSINMLEDDMVLLNKHIENLRQSVFELNKFDGIFEEKQKQLTDALREERVADIKVAELKKEIEVFSVQIEELKERIKKTEQIKQELDYLSELESWLSKDFTPVISFIEKNVMTNLKSKFSQLFSEWFSMLVSDNFNVRLDEDFTPIIEQQDYEIDYAYLSGGERTAIALAYRLSLNQVINSLLSKIKTRDFVILDEPTDGFSDQQLDKIRDVLYQLQVKQLIIVSHEQKIEGFVENVIRFKKQAGVSVRED